MRSRTIQNLVTLFICLCSGMTPAEDLRDIENRIKREKAGILISVDEVSFDKVSNSLHFRLLLESNSGFDQSLYNLQDQGLIPSPYRYYLTDKDGNNLATYDRSALGGSIRGIQESDWVQIKTGMIVGCRNELSMNIFRILRDGKLPEQIFLRVEYLIGGAYKPLDYKEDNELRKFWQRFDRNEPLAVSKLLPLMDEALVSIMKKAIP